ncbi:uncharacterized protein LOC129290771 [Prosopis cineraria]|uniref:uncharacterized protein LOC129290771 n=1 Tax=Prosopis cineraria TaxID=364024 RepID=UPI002410B4BE|nr:uncharacterized protein LOC129290771 [Prosopis cineraria]
MVFSVLRLGVLHVLLHQRKPSSSCSPLQFQSFFRLSQCRYSKWVSKSHSLLKQNGGNDSQIKQIRSLMLVRPHRSAFIAFFTFKDLNIFCKPRCVPRSLLSSTPLSNLFPSSPLSPSEGMAVSPNRLLQVKHDGWWVTVDPACLSRFVSSMFSRLGLSTSFDSS